MKYVTAALLAFAGTLFGAPPASATTATVQLRESVLHTQYLGGFAIAGDNGEAGSLTPRLELAPALLSLADRHEYAGSYLFWDVDYFAQWDLSQRWRVDPAARTISAAGAMSLAVGGSVIGPNCAPCLPTLQLFASNQQALEFTLEDPTRFAFSSRTTADQWVDLLRWDRASQRWAPLWNGFTETQDERFETTGMLQAGRYRVQNNPGSLRADNGRLTLANDWAWTLALPDAAVTAVPEPGALALLLAGLGFVGGAVRRRRRAAAAGVSISAIAWAAGAGAAPLSPTQAVWAVTEIGPLSGETSSPYTSAAGITPGGIVVGIGYTSVGDYRPWAWQAGVLAELPFASSSHASAFANAANDSGMVVGSSGGNAVIWRNGAVSAVLPGLAGATSTVANTVNASGTVAGYSTVAGNLRATNWQGGLATDLGDLPGGDDRSLAYAINRHGTIVGYSEATSGRRAFVWEAGVMTDLGELAGGLDYSIATAINDAGQIAGFSETGNGTRAVLWQGGTMTDLGELAGGTDYSVANGLNNLGTLVGASNGTLGLRAVRWQDGTIFDLNDIPDVAASGLTLTSATGINDLGQMSGNGTRSGDAFGTLRGWQMTLTTTVWEATAGGRWEDRAKWSHGIGPSVLTHAVIDPLTSLTVTGPAASARLLRLTVGGDYGVATLSLAGGLLEVLGSGGEFTRISAKGVLTGDGTLTGAVHNLGRIAATNITLTGLLDNQGTVDVARLRAGGGLLNRGLLTGHGTLTGNLDNGAEGMVLVVVPQMLTVSGGAHTNAGLLEVSAGGRLQMTGSFDNQRGGQIFARAGTLRFDGPLSNAAGGRILAEDAVLRFNSGLANGGELLTTFGETSVFGTVRGTAGGRIIVSGSSLSGSSRTTFYDDVDIQSGSELRVAEGSAAVFFGAVAQHSGALFSGSGAKFFEGGLSVGNSPGPGADSGDVSFGSANVFLAEIGGIERGLGHDHYAVAGALTLGGTLQIVSWDGFVAQAGQRFDLFDWGSASGQFAQVDASALQLAPGTLLDTSRLYLDGSIAITAVPEPGTWALWLLGLAAISTRRGTRR